MRITKEQAERTAKLMTEKKSMQLRQMNLSFSAKIRELKANETPKEVLEVYEKYPNYFNRTTSVYLRGVGFNTDYVNIVSIPYKNDSYFEITKEMGATELLKEFNKIQQLDKDIQSLRLEIETALYSTLKTYKRVQESFPEALQYLPKLNNDKTALVVNLSSLRDKIK
jgi:hypothetical protein